jgi:enoyl-CoA hydratase/carnithine racemase
MAPVNQRPELWLGQSARVLVLTGASERAFAGNDLKATAAATARGERRSTQSAGRRVFFGGVVGRAGKDAD